MKKLEIPIGKEDFKSLRESSYYVDKTSLIKRFIDAPATTCFLFTRPRGFGKSLAISMIETFFIYGESNLQCFKNTYIESLGDEYLSFANTFPVIHLNLKRIEAKNYNEFLKFLAYEMEKLFSNLSKKYDLDENYFSQKIKDDNGIDESLLKKSLDMLMQLIYEKLNKRVILLIDEYDSPLEKAYHNGYYDELQSFFKIFLGDVLKGNQNLEKAIITGVSQIAHASIFSDLNNLRVNSILNNSTDEYFGFTEKEIKELFAYYECEYDQQEVTNWYGGYIINGQIIYNPWSVLSFIDSGCSYDTYWANTGSYSLLKEAVTALADEPYGILLKLASKESIATNIKKDIVFSDATSSMSSLYSMLIFAGYLTGSLLYSPDTYSIRIPNEEIRLAFQREILDYNDKDRLVPLLVDLKNAFIYGENEKIKEILSQYILSSFSYFDLTNEKIYQVIVTTILSLLFNEAIVKSEVIEGDGRCNLFIRSKRNNKIAIIIEFKHRKGKKSSKELIKSSKLALEQIKKKNYVEEAKRNNIENICLYGMAFSGKLIEISQERIM